jgi:hypothetical protein
MKEIEMTMDELVDFINRHDESDFNITVEFSDDFVPGEEGYHV